MSENTEKKLRASTVVFPSTGKGKIIALFALLTFVLCLWPLGIFLFNRNVLVLGLPLIVVWGLGLILYIMVLLGLAIKWRVH